MKMRSIVHKIFRNIVSVSPQDLLVRQRPVSVSAVWPGGLRQQGHAQQPHQSQTQR